MNLNIFAILVTKKDSLVRVFYHILLIQSLVVLAVKSANSQTITDTVYCDKEWKLTTKNNYHYYRTYFRKDSLLIVNDYYKNGSIQMKGSYYYTDSTLARLISFENIDAYKFGEFVWYNQKGIRTLAKVYRPFLNVEATKNYYKDSLNSISTKEDIWYMEVDFSVKGKLKSISFYNEELKLHGPDLGFYKNTGILFYSIDYVNDKQHGFEKWYDYEGKLTEVVEYKNGKKHGESRKYNFKSQIKSVKRFEDGKVIYRSDSIDIYTIPKEDTLRTYLVNNSKCLKAESDFDFLKPDIIGNKFIVTGELHTMGNNHEIEFLLFKYLNKTIGTRVLVIEMPKRVEKNYQDYFRTGNPKVLEKIIDFYTRKEDNVGDLLKKYYEYNLSLPEDKKIIVKCIDYDYDKYYFFEHLQELIAPIKLEYMPSEIKKVLNDVSQLTLYNSGKMDEVVENVNSNEAIYESMYKEIFGSSYNDFRLTINRYRTVPEYNTLFFNNAILGDTIRENILFENMLKVVAEYPNETFFGQFGKVHISLNENTQWGCRQNWSSFVSRLNNYKHSGLKGKILSIPYYYYDSNTDLIFNCNTIISNNQIHIYKELTRAPFTIFKMFGNSFPSHKKEMNFQYLIIQKKEVK